MAKEFPLAVVIKAVDKVTAPLARINRSINQFTAPVRRLGAAFSALGKESGITKLGMAIGKVGGQLASLTRKMVIFGGVAGGIFVAITKRAIDAADALNDLRNQTGITANKISQLKYAFSQSGVSGEEFDSSLRKMTVGLGQAKRGTGALATYLKKTNPELLKQLNTAKDSDTKLNILLNALDKTTDAEQRAALGAAAFGRGVGIKMAGAMKDGKQSLKAMMEEFKAANPDMDALATSADGFNDSMGRMNMIGAGLFNRVLLPLLPAFEKLATILGTKLLSNAENISKWAEDFAASLPARVEEITATFKRWGERLSWVERNFGLLNTAIVAVAGVVFGPLILAFTQFLLVLTPVLYKMGALVVIAAVKFFTDVAVAMRLAGGAMQFFNIMMWANPIGIIIAGIVALIAIGYVLVKNWDDISAFFGEIWGRMKASVSGVGEWILDVFDNVSDYVMGVFKGIGEVLDWVGRKLGIVSTESSEAVSRVEGSMRRMQNATPAGAAPVQAGAGRAFTPVSNGQAQTAAISVDFTNMPKGTRVSKDPRSTATVDTSLGYNMMLGGAY